MSDFHQQKTVKSRKARRCRCTDATIEEGAEYVRFSGVCEGDFYSVAVHPSAAEIYNRHCQRAWDNGDDGLSFDDLLESLRWHSDDQSEAERKIVAALPGVPRWFVDSVNGTKETE